ncbi:MAG: DUF6391 domain-containing protein [Chloroflexi bacterium]|nr:DUF6391 domain-containing protein [Chloroflexota bacterium]
MIENLIRRVRRNHALEHATVTLLLERGMTPPLGGYSTPGGFFIFGRVPTDLLQEVVTKALAELNGGNKELAISPHCGTNLAAGTLIGVLLANAILGKRREGRLRRIPLAVTGLVLGVALGRPVGNVLQRRYTTLAQMDGLEVGGITSLWPGDAPGLHRVRTVQP